MSEARKFFTYLVILGAVASATLIVAVAAFWLWYSAFGACRAEDHPGLAALGPLALMLAGVLAAAFLIRGSRGTRRCLAVGMLIGSVLSGILVFDYAVEPPIWQSECHGFHWDNPPPPSAPEPAE
ncbi:hypothetical protein [Nocardia australiensis]|uniref:hypothetical protein n=1 Tax=Nocardia australiensis TaxID=2887191 RepID=UPI001D145CC1|nr:hypothetical protein [Nocardia australiensis]